MSTPMKTGKEMSEMTMKWREMAPSPWMLRLSPVVLGQGLRGEMWGWRQRGRVYARKEGRRQDRESTREGRKIKGFEVIQLLLFTYTTPYSPFCINNKTLIKCYFLICFI